ncbi:MAG: Ig-like domain-containing protein [Proteobacteria bacterium]|nr:Ig-like domain-containing protein [Pseudomonadota bacterium]
MMQRFLRFLRLGLPLALCLALVACSDDASKKNNNNTEDPCELDDSCEDKPIDPNDPLKPPPGGFTMLLVPFMATDVDVNLKGSVVLKVMLVSTEKDTMGNGVADERIKWSISSGSDFANLRAQNSTTDFDGYASITLTAGAASGKVVVAAEHSHAPKRVIFNINVLDLPTGNLTVYANYTGMAPVRHYSIRLHDYDDIPCYNFDPAYPPIAEPLDKIDDSAARFEKLSTEQKYSLIAYGYAENGTVVAAGCLDTGLNILANQTIEAIINLNTIRLNPVTTYHVRSYFDFGDIVNSLGQVGQMINMVTNFADNPGRFIYDQIIGLVKAAVGGLAGAVVDWIMGAVNLDDLIANTIDNVVTSSQTGCQVGLFACQLRSLVRTMELMGDLDIQSAGAITLTGKNSYTGLSVYWRIGCDGTDPNCGRLPVDTNALGASLALLEGSWNGSLSNGYDRISIETHELSLQYGKIAVFLIEKVLLPRIAGGATTFPAAIAYWINCNTLGQSISNALSFSLPSWLSWIYGSQIVIVNASTATGWCTGAANTIAGVLNFATALGSLQSANSNVSISGSAILNETNGDYVIDHIDNGKWNGSLTMRAQDGSTSSTAVIGIWSGYNKANNPDGYCSFPKTSTDSADQKCAYPPIDTNALVTSNMCSKYAACAK